MKIQIAKTRFTGHHDYFLGDAETEYEIAIIATEELLRIMKELEGKRDSSIETFTQALIDLYFPDPIKTEGRIWHRASNADCYYAIRKLRDAETLSALIKPELLV